MPYIGQSPATGEANSFKTLDDITSYTLTFDGSSASTVSVANDTITEREHRFVTGQRVTYNDGGGTAITGLSDGVYYIIVEDRHTIKLATNANNAASGTAINLTGLGVGGSHTLNVAFDGVNTKFKATVNNGTKADITAAPQLMLSINGVLQQPHNNTTTPATGYAVDHTSTIIFSAAPNSTDQFFGSLVASNYATFDISDNTVDNFTGDGSTTDFTLSKEPPNNESVLVTIDGVVQYPDDTSAVRAYSVSGNILSFVSAPGLAVEIQVRHIGFAGASSAGITGFYGRTGNAVLKNTDNIVFNNATASGTVQAANVTVTGDLTVQGTTTTLDTELTSVDKLEVAANNTTVGVAITQSGSGDILNLYDGATEVFTVKDGGNVGIGTNDPGSNKLQVEGLTSLQHFSSYRKDGSLSYGPGGMLTFLSRGSTSGVGGKSGYAAIRGRKYTSSANTTLTDTWGITLDGGAYFNDKVGIGSDNPREKLDISAGRIILDQDYQFTWANGTTNRARIYGDSGNNFVVENGSSNTERLRITSDGNIGIGTNTFTATSSGRQIVEIEGASGALINLAVGGARKAYHFTDGTDVYSYNTASGAYIIGTNDTKRLSVSSGGETTMHVNSASHDTFKFTTQSSNEAKLIMKDASNNDDIVLNTGGNSWINGGNVGISENNPQALLHLNDGANSTIMLGNTTHGYKLRANVTGSNDYGFLIEDEDGVDLYRVTSSTGTTDPNTHRFYTGGAERLRIDLNGRLCLGDTAVTGYEQIYCKGSNSTTAGIYIHNANGATNSSADLWFGNWTNAATNANYAARISAVNKNVNTAQTDLRFHVYDGSNVQERMRIQHDGDLFVAGAGGMNTAQLPNGSRININGTSSNDGFSVIRYNSGYGAYGLNIGRSKSSTLGTNAAVTNGNDLGHISFYGADGTDFNMAAQITSQVDGTPSDGADMPGRLLFKTSPDGSATPTERMRIQSDGKVSIGGMTAYTAFEVKGHSTNWNDAVYGMVLTGDRDISSGYAGSGILLGGEYKTGDSEITTFAYISGVKENTTTNNYDGSLRMGTRVNGGNATEALRIDSAGRITTGGRTASNHGSPKFILWGSDPYFYFGSTNSVNNSSNVGIKFAIAGGSTGDYSKAGIFVKRQDSYNDLDMIFAFRSSNDSTGVSVSDEKVRITSDGNVNIGGGQDNGKLTIQGTNAYSGSSLLLYEYTKQSVGGIRVIGSEASVEIIGQDDGTHSADIMLRYANNGFIMNANPTDDTLDINAFTASGNGFTSHSTGSNQSYWKQIAKFHRDGGLSFNGDTAAVNRLDDYEEGSWTPVLSSNSTNPTYTMTGNWSYYIKIGRLVHFNVDIQVTTTNVGSGNLYVSIPFAVDTTTSTKMEHYVGGVGGRSQSFLNLTRAEIGWYYANSVMYMYRQNLSTYGEAGALSVSYIRTGSNRLTLQGFYYSAS